MMNNASSLTDEQINQMLIERGLKKADASASAQPQLTDDQIRQMMQARGLSSQGQHSPLQALLNIGGGIAQGAESAVAGLENLPRDVGLLGRYLGVPGVRQLARLPAVHAMPAPFAQQQALTTQLPQAASEALGILGTGGAAGIRGAGEVAGAVGRGIGRAARRIGEPIGRRVIEPIAKKLAPITGRTAKETAINYFNEISQGAPVKQLYTPLNKEIIGLHKGAKEIASSNYDRVKDLANKYGFSDEVEPVATNGGTIDDTAVSRGLYINPKKSLDLISALKDDDPAIAKDAAEFTKNPSFNSAHELQSKLGRKYYSLEHGDGEDRKLAFKFNEARGALKDDIFNSIDEGLRGQEAKAENLKNTYRDAGKFYKEEVIPFYEDKLISDMLFKKGGVKNNPSGIFNLLKKDSDSTEFIKNRLSPEGKDLFVAHGIENVFPKIKGTTRVSPKNFIKEFDNLSKKGLGEFITNEHNVVRAKVENQYALSKALRKYGTRGAEIAGGTELAKQIWDRSR